MRQVHYRVVAGAALALLWGSVAWADVVMPPPPDCPPGTSATTSHAGPHCAPRSCKDSSQCKDTEICRAQKLCLVERDFLNREGPGTMTVAEGPCRDGQCARGRCSSLTVCIPKQLATEDGAVVLARETSTGGPAEPRAASKPEPEAEQEPLPTSVPPTQPGCHASLVAGAGGGALLLLALIWLLARRRRRAR